MPSIPPIGPSEEEQLIDRIAKGHVSREQARLLKKLFVSGGMTGPEIEVYFEALRKQKGDKDAVVLSDLRRKRAFDLRAALQRYSMSNEGLAQRWTVSLAKLKRAKEDEKYRLTFQPNPPRTATAFWLEHVTNGRGNLIVLSAPYHFRSTVLRGYGSTFSARAASQMFECQPEDRHLLDDLREAVSDGDARAGETLQRYFRIWEEEYGRPPVQVLTTKQSLLGQENLVLIRTGNPHLGFTYGEGPFIRHVPIKNDSSSICRALNVEPFFWLRAAEDKFVIPEDQMPHSVAGVLVRLREEDGRIITIIESTAPLGAEILAECITDDQHIQSLIKFTETQSDWQGFPESFQTLFQVYADPADLPRAQIIFQHHGPAIVP